jgi:hypothetical protein
MQGHCDKEEKEGKEISRAGKTPSSTFPKPVSDF